MRLVITVPYQTELLLAKVKRQYPQSPHLVNTLTAAALQRGLRDFQQDPAGFAAELEVRLIPVRITTVAENEVREPDED